MPRKVIGEGMGGWRDCAAVPKLRPSTSVVSGGPKVQFILLRSSICVRVIMQPSDELNDVHASALGELAARLSVKPITIVWSPKLSRSGSSRLLSPGIGSPRSRTRLVPGTEL